MKYSISHIRHVLDWMEARGCEQWKQEHFFQMMLRRRGV